MNTGFFYIVEKDRGGYLEQNPIEGLCFNIITNHPHVLRFDSEREAKQLIKDNFIDNVEVVFENHHKEAYNGRK